MCASVVDAMRRRRTAKGPNLENSYGLIVELIWQLFTLDHGSGIARISMKVCSFWWYYHFSAVI